jgi:hypothetical protein
MMLQVFLVDVSLFQVIFISLVVLVLVARTKLFVKGASALGCRGKSPKDVGGHDRRQTETRGFTSLSEHDVLGVEMWFVISSRWAKAALDEVLGPET